MPRFVTIISIVIVCLILALVIESKFIEYLGNENVSLRMQIESLKTQSEQQATRAKLAQETADMEMQKTKAVARNILTAKVPSNCNDAIKWAINEARNFN